MDLFSENNDVNRFFICKECGISFNYCLFEVSGDLRNIVVCGK